MKCITYKTGYKYQLTEEYTDRISVKPENDIVDFEYIRFTIDGTIAIKKGYAWDGPSGPAVDTLNFMRGSLVHDALYQLMREEKLDRVIYKEGADKLLQRMCVEDGMSSIRAWWVYQGISLGGGSATRAANKKAIVQAPESCQ